MNMFVCIVFFSHSFVCFLFFFCLSFCKLPTFFGGSVCGGEAEDVGVCVVGQYWSIHRHTGLSVLVQRRGAVGGPQQLDVGPLGL